MAYNHRQVLLNNLDAIRTAFALNKSSEKPTNLQLEILKKYAGFGGLKAILRPLDAPETWSKADFGLYNIIKSLHETIRLNTTNDKEYDSYVNSLKNSVLTSFYTPKPITNAIASVISNHQVPHQAIIEPSSGTGVFLSSLIDTNIDFNKDQSLAIEKDKITSLILKAIHGDSLKVINEGFEDINEKYNLTFDIALSNIPFGDIKVFDPSFAIGKDLVNRASTNKLHTYFFSKAITQVKDGGLIAFITTDTFLNTGSNETFRTDLFKKTKLISAVRLPHNLFKDEANTEVGSDLIIVQKRTKQEPLTKDELDIIQSTVDENGVVNNVYFNKRDHKNIIYTTSQIDTNQYGKPAIIYTYENTVDELAYELELILTNDFGQHYSVPNVALNNTIKPTVSNQKPKVASPQLNMFDLFGVESFEHKSYPFTGVIQHFYRANTVTIFDNKIGYLSEFNFDDANNPKAKFNLYAGNVIKASIEQVELYTKLRDSYFLLSCYENEFEVEHPQYRADLNIHYDQYVAKYGNLQNPTSTNLLLQDALGKNVLYLEKKNRATNKYEKSDIFQEPIGFNNKPIKIENPDDALTYCLNVKGRVDLDFICELLERYEPRVIKDLQSKIYLNPANGLWETAEDYLSGNVILKLAQAETALFEQPNHIHYNQSKDAIVKVQPKEISFEEIDFNLGERWIPIHIYKQFGEQLFNAPLEITFVKSQDEFDIKCNSWNTEIREKYAVRANRIYSGIDLFEHALKNTCPQITMTVMDKKVPDKEAIQKAFLITEDIRAQFPEWLSKQENDFKDNLTKIYNHKFNCYVKRNFDGSHLTFPNAVFKDIVMYPTQKNAIHMICQQYGGIIDHEVGTGKTFIMALAAGEMKRLRLAEKPMIIGLKANVGDIATAYRMFYPDARILAPDEKDFLKHKRIDLLNSIKENNWDVIILSHEQFGMIPQSSEEQMEILQEELDMIESDLALEKFNKGTLSIGALKGLEKRKANYEAKFLELKTKIESNKDDTVDFKQMNIGHLLVDEAHSFKNLDFTTRHTRVAGLSNGNVVQKCRNLLVAIRTLQKEKGTDLCATFLSGTTITNSLVELYSLFKYLRPKELARQDVSSFDSWAAIYTQKTTEFEFNMTGQIVQKERLRHFIKVPELAMFYNAIADVKTAEDAGIDRPTAEHVLENTPASKEDKVFTQNLIDFARTGDGSLIDRAQLSKNEENAKMLIACNAAKLMAMDLRLIDANKYSDNHTNKCSIAASRIADHYYESQDFLGTQLVFSDVGTPKPHEFNIYSELKRKLIETHNIPINEIVFVHDWDTNTKKKELRKLVNAGKVRVVIGSTVKLGVGWNVQERIVALHSLDIPWRPSDLDQREGRGKRTGNWVAKLHFDNNIKHYVYAKDNSLDVYKFNLLTNKQRFISQIKKASITSRRIDEGSLSEDGGMNFSEYVALLSGNQDLLIKSKLDKKISVLESEKKLFYDDIQRNKKRFKDLTISIPLDQEYLLKLKECDAHYHSILKHDPKIGSKINLIKLKEVNSAETSIIGKYILSLSKSFEDKIPKVIGELYGFDLIVKHNTIYHENTFHAVKNGLELSFNGGYPNDNPMSAARYFLSCLDNISSKAQVLDNSLARDVETLNYLETMTDTKWKNEQVLTDLKLEVKTLVEKMTADFDAKDKEMQALDNLDKETKSNYTPQSIS